MWQALVAEVLLHRTRARQAEDVFRELRRRYRTAAAFGSATREELLGLFEPLGLRWRAELVVRLAAEIGVRHGRLPKDAAALRTMPGVGDYAAAAALSLHAGQRAVIVDSNVVRVLCRLVGAEFDGETRRAKWLGELADRLTPDVEFRAYNYALLDLGMQICRPARPRCVDCPLLPMCTTGRDHVFGAVTSTVENSA